MTFFELPVGSKMPNGVILVCKEYVISISVFDMKMVHSEQQDIRIYYTRIFEIVKTNLETVRIVRRK